MGWLIYWEVNGERDEFYKTRSIISSFSYEFHELQIRAAI